MTKPSQHLYNTKNYIFADLQKYKLDFQQELSQNKTDNPKDWYTDKKSIEFKIARFCFALAGKNIIAIML